jgi:hypothetical protein
VPYRRASVLVPKTIKVLDTRHTLDNPSQVAPSPGVYANTYKAHLLELSGLVSEAREA